MQIEINGIVDAKRQSLTHFFEIFDNVASLERGKQIAERQRKMVRLDTSRTSSVFSISIHTTEITWVTLACTEDM